jgi:signal transduction histidine kinase
LAFVFSFLGAILAPVAWLLNVRFPPEAGPFFSTLFVLTLVTALVAIVIRLRGHKLTTALAQVHEYERQLLVTERVAAVGTLAAGAAHDFNNALTTIAGFADLALDDPKLSAQTRSDFEQIRVAARSSESIVAGLLGVVRRLAGGASPRHLRDAVAMPLAMLERELRRKHIDVVTDVDPVLPEPAVDLVVLSQVCLNLYLNARDAMLPAGGGRLLVSVRNSPTGIAISVKDTGTGIPQEFRDRIFEPLQTTKGDRGTGLGLAVSKRVIASAGGRLTFETEEGHGTRFLIELPATPVDVVEPALSSRRALSAAVVEA